MESQRLPREVICRYCLEQTEMPCLTMDEVGHYAALNVTGCCEAWSRGGPLKSADLEMAVSLCEDLRAQSSLLQAAAEQIEALSAEVKSLRTPSSPEVKS